MAGHIKSIPLLIEGMPGVEEQHLVTGPAGFVAPISTYVPEGMAQHHGRAAPRVAAHN